ncbi:phosphoenolpyruvate--protein phosphotransferase [candidate division NPL-UPA2 bacterium]|nr:phosphoenolpyruvate--protein phosphotransferase [candidate division NPL-UPA2 bacterium]
MEKIELKGIGVSPGVISGKVFLLTGERFSIPKREISEGEVAEELARFEKALAQTTEEVVQIRKKVAKEIDEEHAHILDAHLLVLEDILLIEETMKRVEKEKLNVEYLFSRVLENLAEKFEAMDDAYLKGRAADVRDVGRRVLRNLLGREHRDLSSLEEEVIVVAYDLSPSDTAAMHREKVIAFVTDVGGKTSHTAIMARALEIPAVVALRDVTAKVKRGDRIIVDGTNGMVIINPDEETLKKYEAEEDELEVIERKLEEFKDLAGQTLDGHRLELAANLEMPEEIPSILAHGAEGIGLYRTEFFYLNRTDLPTEDEHYQAYKFVAEKMAPHSAIIRTLDLGGDKFLSQLQTPREMNPFLGWRAIRFCLERPDIFKTQLRAILRASVHGKLKIMYPLISGVEELRRANQILKEVREELRAKAVAFDENLEVGAMIETPSAAMTADILAREVDFFSIGTNDLIQYSLAIDRVNEKIGYLYEPAHPAVLRLIKSIVEAGHRQRIWVGMCGEMAAEPIFAIILLGMGLDELSMSAVAIPKIKKIIRAVTMKEARRLVKEILTLSTAREIEQRVREKLAKVAPDVLTQLAGGQ